MEISSTSSSEDRALGLLTLRWWLAGILVFFIVLAPTFRPTAELPGLRYQRKVLHPNWKDAAILILGDSRTESAIDPRLFPVIAYNSAIPSLSASGVATLLRELPTHAQQLVIGLSAPMFHRHNRAMTSGWLGVQAEVGDSPSFWRWSGTRGIAELRLNRWWYELEALRQTAAPGEGLLDYARRLAGRYEPPRRGVVYEYDEETGFLSYLTPEDESPREQIDAALHRYEGEFEMTALLALLEVTDSLRERGREIAFFRTPVSDGFQQLETRSSAFDSIVPTTIRERGYPWFDLNTGAAVDYAYFDGHHLIKDSAQLATRALISRMSRADEISDTAEPRDGH